MKVYVEYAFIFDPGQLWENMRVANDDLRSFFRQKGFEAEVVESSSEDPAKYNNRIMIYLAKIDNPPLPSPPVIDKNKTMGQILKPLRQKKDWKGKFVRDNRNM